MKNKIIKIMEDILPNNLRFIDNNGWLSIMDNTTLKVIETGLVDWKLKELQVDRSSKYLKEIFADNDFLVTLYNKN